MSSHVQPCFVLVLCAILVVFIGAGVAAEAEQSTSQQPQLKFIVKNISANGLVFTCNVLGSSAAKEQVFFLHGFPEFRVFWNPVLQRWAQQSADVYAVACDLRGYSSGASPDGAEHYSYEIFALDTFAIADACGMKKFHLVGHDHGALLGWFMANTNAPNSDRIITYTSLASPHLGPFNKALEGGWELQQLASMYFNELSLVDSASRNNNALFHFPWVKPLFPTVKAFQKALWWYYGSVTSVMSKPPIFPHSTIKKVTWPPMDFVLGIDDAVPMPVRPSVVPTNYSVGFTAQPTTFICGTYDIYLLCPQFAKSTGEWVKGEYTFVEVPCGHELFHLGNATEGCDTSSDVEKVIAAISAQVGLHH